ncbi:MAG: hypothetical protein AB1304_11610 [Bacteroidota bacterium]
MAIYKDTHDSLMLEELHLYGSQRLGIIKENHLLAKYVNIFPPSSPLKINTPNLPYLPSIPKSISIGGPVLLPTYPTLPSVQYYFGKKHYELTDWLGNVRVVINDKKTPMGTDSSDMTYAAQVLEVNDYYPFGSPLYGRRWSAGYRYGFGKHEKDNEISGEGNHLSFGDYGYSTRLARRWNVDPKAHIMAGWSPYVATANNPIIMVDPNGQLPWPIHVRSFISTPTTGAGLFRGDGRGPSLSTARDVTSRVRTSFVVDPAKGIITTPSTASDPTVFYGGFIGGTYIPPVVKRGKPTASITNVKFSQGSVAFDFSHSGKDPITPQWATPALDVHASLSITEDLENGILNVSGSFTGDKFPSTEAFITDQSGKTKLFLGAKMETGGITDLYGDNKEKLFNVNMQIQIDKSGNFIGVKEGDKTYSVEEWNKKITEDTNK